MARPTGGKNVNWDRGELIELYWGQGMATRAIGELFSVGRRAVSGAMRRLGIPFRTRSEERRGVRCCNWKGGRTVTSKGYVWVYNPEHPRADKSPYVAEHILVWEKVNRQRLPADWIVHHINGTKDDNEPSNLMGLTRSIHSTLTNYKRWHNPILIRNRKG